MGARWGSRLEEHLGWLGQHRTDPATAPHECPYCEASPNVGGGDRREARRGPERNGHEGFVPVTFNPKWLRFDELDQYRQPLKEVA